MKDCNLKEVPTPVEKIADPLTEVDPKNETVV